MNTTVIEMVQLTRCFKENTAVDHLSLEVHAGEIFGFLGHNGAGKTTTIRLLNGILEPTAGNINVLGLDPQTDGALLRRRTGVLTETPSLDERLSAWDNLSIYADLYSVPKACVTQRITELLSEFDLADCAQKRVSGFSKGMKQRLALARALQHKPELLFLDEPTSGLDPLSARHVNDLIERLARRDNCTVFLTTHNLVEAQRLCDRVAILEHGRLMALGTPAELTRQYIRQLEVEIEVSREQVEIALKVLRCLPGLVIGDPRQSADNLVVTVNGREAIPDLLKALLTTNLRVFRIAAQEANLEQVYFALHGEKGGVQ